MVKNSVLQNTLRVNMNLTDFYKKIYVVHYTPLVDRKRYLVQKFKELGLEDRVEFVEKYQDISELEGVTTPYTAIPRIMCINLAHIYCYEEQLKNNYDHILILEDDTYLDTFEPISFLNKVAEEFVENDGDVAFVGTCCGMKVETPIPGKTLYYNPDYTTRCAGAYVLNKRCVQTIIDTINHYASIDHILNPVITENKLRCLWSYPAFEQGSENGKYKSNLLQYHHEYHT